MRTRTRTDHFTKSEDNAGVTAIVTEPVAPAPRQLTLEENEVIIKKGLDAFWDVGEALMDVHDRELWREKYLSFDDYLEKRWGWSARHSRRQISAAKIHANLRLALPGFPLPATESQVRPLAAVPEAEQPKVWTEAVKLAEPSKVTAKHVEAVVEKSKWPRPDSNGCYPEGTRAKYEMFDAEIGHARVGVLQVGENTWCGRCAHMFPSHGGGTAEGFYFKNVAFEELVARKKAAERLIDDLERYKQRVRGTKATAIAQDMIDWAHKFLPDSKPRNARETKVASEPRKREKPESRAKSLVVHKPAPTADDMREAIRQRISQRLAGATSAVFNLQEVLPGHEKYQHICRQAMAALDILKENFVRNVPASYEPVDPGAKTYVFIRKPVRGMRPPHDRPRFAGKTIGKWFADPDKVKDPFRGISEAQPASVQWRESIVNMKQAREISAAAAVKKKKGKK